MRLGWLLCSPLLLASWASAGSSALPQRQISWDLYHKTDVILDFFKKISLKQPTKVRYEEIPDTEAMLRLPVVTITDFGSGENGKEVVLLVAGEHARELITSEIAYWLGALLAGAGEAEGFGAWPAVEAVTAKAVRKGWAKRSLALLGEDLLKRVVFKIIPVENIQGRKGVESGDMCLRKTASGVDLNRNWETAWREGVAGGDEYGGPKAFSEPEARIVRLVAETSRPQAFVNLHSGEWAVYAPWDSKAELAPKLPKDTSVVLDKLNAFCECMTGAAGAVAGYLAYGTSMDYMYDKLHVPYALTVEVYGPNGLGKLATGGKPRRALQVANEEIVKELAAQEAVEREAGLPLGDLDEDARPKVSSEIGAGAGGSAGAAKGVTVLREGLSTQEKCLFDYNPLTKEAYEDVVGRWVGALLVLGAHLAEHPSASSANAEAEQEQLPLPPTPPSKQDLVAKGQGGALMQRTSSFGEGSGGRAGAWLSSSYALPSVLQHKVLESGSGSGRVLLLGALGFVILLAAAGLFMLFTRPKGALPVRRKGAAMPRRHSRAI